MTAATASRGLLQDIDELSRALQLSAADRALLMQIADEAAARFDAEAEALPWFDDEVKRRNPNLWWSVRMWITRHSNAD